MSSDSVYHDSGDVAFAKTPI